MVVVEAIFEIFRQKSDLKPVLRVPIVLKPSKMDSMSKIRTRNDISGILRIPIVLKPSKMDSTSKIRVGILIFINLVSSGGLRTFK